MSKMSNIDQILKDGLEALKDITLYIVIAIIIIVLGFLEHGKQNFNKEYAENRINTIEWEVEEQMNYIHELEADVDNLYRVVE